MSITQNYFSPLEFKVAVRRLPNVVFFTTKATIPGISSSPVSHPTMFNNVFRGGDELEFSDLELEFVLDENLKNYSEIFEWMQKTTFPETHEQYKELKDSEEGLVSDISIVIVNSKKNPSIEFVFHNCFPTTLSPISMDTSGSSVEYPTATANFRYDTFKMINLLTT